MSEQEASERLVKGDKGDKGERGEGMPRGTRNAIVFLFCLAFAVGAASMLFTVAYYHSTQDAQRQQGEIIEVRLCTTLGALAALKPPSGSPAANPARGYDQELHAVLAQLGPDVGCR